MADDPESPYEVLERRSAMYAFMRHTEGLEFIRAVLKLGLERGELKRWALDMDAQELELVGLKDVASLLRSYIPKAKADEPPNPPQWAIESMSTWNHWLKSRDRRAKFLAYRKKTETGR